MLPEDYVGIEFQLDKLVDRLSWFALDDVTVDELRWVLAEWIDGMVYGYSVGRFDNWEQRFIWPLTDFAEIADCLVDPSN